MFPATAAESLRYVCLPAPPAPGLFYESVFGCPFFSFLFSFYRSSYPHDKDKIADFERVLVT